MWPQKTKQTRDNRKNFKFLEKGMGIKSERYAKQVRDHTFLISNLFVYLSLLIHIPFLKLKVFSII